MTSFCQSRFGLSSCSFKFFLSAIIESIQMSDWCVSLSGPFPGAVPSFARKTFCTPYIEMPLTHYCFIDSALCSSERFYTFHTTRQSMPHDHCHTCHISAQARQKLLLSCAALCQEGGLLSICVVAASAKVN